MKQFESLNILNASGGDAPTIALVIESASLEQPICLVKSYKDCELQDAHGEIRLFKACALTVNLPERNTSGFTDLSFTIADTNGVCFAYAQQIVNNADTSQLYFLEYLPNEIEPCYKLRLSITNADIGTTQSTFSAGWHDTLNRQFPYQRYTASKFPGLKYVY